MFNRNSDVAELMECLKIGEPPLVAYYTGTQPEKSIGPRSGLDINIASPAGIFMLLKHRGSLEKMKKERFSCMLQFIMRTRKTGVPSVFSSNHFGCPGLKFYAGFCDKLPSFNHHFISTGIPGFYPGERFVQTPDSAKRSGQALEGSVAKGEYLVFEPYAENGALDKVESVMLFANPEIMAGLIGLVRFATDSDTAVQSIYCSGCASLFTWPVKLQMQGKEQAVLGIFDLAARPWLKNGELTLAMAPALFIKILKTFRDSFIYKQKRHKGKKELMFGWKEALARADDFEKRMRS